MEPIGYDGIIVNRTATAQANPKPPRHFNLHVINRPNLATALDDPSYGQNGFADPLTWQMDSLMGFYYDDEWEVVFNEETGKFDVEPKLYPPSDPPVLQVEESILSH